MTGLDLMRSLTELRPFATWRQDGDGVTLLHGDEVIATIYHGNDGVMVKSAGFAGGMCTRLPTLDLALRHLGIAIEAQFVSAVQAVSDAQVRARSADALMTSFRRAGGRP